MATRQITSPKPKNSEENPIDALHRRPFRPSNSSVSSSSKISFPKIHKTDAEKITQGISSLSGRNTTLQTIATTASNMDKIWLIQKDFSVKTIKIIPRIARKNFIPSDFFQKKTTHTAYFGTQPGKMPYQKSRADSAQPKNIRKKFFRTCLKFRPTHKTVKYAEAPQTCFREIFSRPYWWHCRKTGFRCFSALPQSRQNSDK